MIEKDGYVLQFEIESGEPYWITKQQYELKQEFMKNILSKVNPDKKNIGQITIISTMAEDSDNNLRELWDAK